MDFCVFATETFFFAGERPLAASLSAAGRRASGRRRQLAEMSLAGLAASEGWLRVPGIIFIVAFFIIMLPLKLL